MERFLMIFIGCLSYALFDIIMYFIKRKEERTRCFCRLIHLGENEWDKGCSGDVLSQINGRTVIGTLCKKCKYRLGKYDKLKVRASYIKKI